MPPITIHNLPVPPREVAEAFRLFDIWIKERDPDATLASPVELEYCAIIYDTGVDSVSDRLMLIEAVDDGYPFELLIIFRSDGSTKTVLLNADDEEHSELIWGKR